ncbi:MaoC family dehydratase [Nocardiopsis quinghaiensis]|uniref:MaoC family dehydratase n=1 Tax=Nocardiopsis quinghaiensis TaxID=464995 RepID=UPI00123BF5D6|nr:MaoC family dehydratase [Nocardiopsis quinghaiensis]
MRVFADINEVIASQGEHLGYTDWVTIDQERISLFADATEDRQWIHIDQEKAAAGPFGGTIAHGFLTLSMLAHFSQSSISLTKKPSMSINYGLNKVRFLQPVPSGSRIRDGIELSSVQKSPKGYLVATTHTVEIEDHERPALVAESLGLWVP